MHLAEARAPPEATNQYCGDPNGMSIEGNPFHRDGDDFKPRGFAREHRMNDAVMTGPVAGLAASAAECLARARALIPLLQSAAPRIDAHYQLPRDVLGGLHDAGMFLFVI